MLKIKLYIKHIKGWNLLFPITLVRGKRYIIKLQRFIGCVIEKHVKVKSVLKGWRQGKILQNIYVK